MSQPVPDAPVQSVFAVPEHIHSVILGGGCGEAHFPQNGAVDCARCAAVVKPYSFPAAPESAPASEQPAQASADAPSAPSPEAAAPVADAPQPKSKRSTPPDDAAPSA
jgi:hypothetical protein